MNLKLTISFLLPVAFMSLLVACGGGNQTADTPTPEATVVVKAIVEPTPTKEPPKPESAKPPAPESNPTEAPTTPIPTVVSTPIPTPTEVPPTTTPLLPKRRRLKNPSITRVAQHKRELNPYVIMDTRCL